MVYLCINIFSCTLILSLHGKLITDQIFLVTSLHYWSNNDELRSEHYYVLIIYVIIVTKQALVASSTAV